MYRPTLRHNKIYIYTCTITEHFVIGVPPTPECSSCLDLYIFWVKEGSREWRTIERAGREKEGGGGRKGGREIETLV